jgi:hypothetical protein
MSKFGPLGVALTGVAGVAGFGLMVKSSFDAIDANSKLAKALGVTTENLTGMMHAADLSGVKADAMQAGLKRLVRQGMTLDQLADKMAAIESPTERAQLAVKVLGKSGQDMIPLLTQGGDAIRAMAKEGAELKGVSGIDSAKVEAANDAVSRVKASFVGIANSLAVTLSPWLDKIAVKALAFGRMARSAFESIRPIINQVGNVIAVVWDSVSTKTAEVFAWITGESSITFMDIREFALDSLIAIEFGFENMGAIAALAWEKTKLAGVSFWEGTKHLFTAELPAVLTWFGENWRDIFFTATDYALTVMINLGKNIRTIFSNVMKIIKGEMSFKDIMSGVEKDLSKGFVNSIKKMPDIPKRALTELEKELGLNIETMSTGLTDKLTDKIVKRRQELLGEGDTPQVREKLKVGEIQPKTQAAPASGVLQRGSAQAFSAIFSSMRGGTTQEKLLKNGEQQLAEAKKQTGKLSDLAIGTSVEIVAGDAF